MNGPSKICGRQPSTNFTSSIREYFVPYNTYDYADDFMIAG